ncbi:uncharacterized protein [Palaemon carinicauda]|uniref:uncharacterized protein isoform X1 n=1 Tax=Palaemon carinicauda TaxID=392227 RepID=UPI0035B6884E
MAVVPEVLNRWRGGLLGQTFLYVELFLLMALVFSSCSSSNRCSTTQLKPKESIFSSNFGEGKELQIETFKSVWDPFQIKLWKKQENLYTMEFVNRFSTLQMNVRNTGKILLREELQINFRRNEMMIFAFKIGESGAWVVEVRKGDFMRAVQLTDVSLDEVDDIEVYNEQSSVNRKVRFCNAAFPVPTEAQDTTTSPFCQTCPEKAPFPECKSCPVCQACPEKAPCPECKSCPVCQACPEKAPCPECKSCPVCQACPEKAPCPECKSCPVCQACPEKAPCPECEEVCSTYQADYKCSSSNRCSTNQLKPEEGIFSTNFAEGKELQIETFKGVWNPFKIRLWKKQETLYIMEFVNCFSTFQMNVRNTVKILLRENLQIDFRRNEMMIFAFKIGESGAWVVEVRKGDFMRAVQLTDVSLDEVDDIEVYNEGRSRNRKVLFCNADPINHASVTSDVAPPRVPRINSSGGAESQETCSCLVSTPLLYVMLSVCVLFPLALVIFIVQEFRQLLKKMKRSVDQENSQVTHEPARSLEQGHEKRDSSQRPKNNFEEYLAPKTFGRTSCVETSCVVRAGEEDHVYFEISNSRPTK